MQSPDFEPPPVERDLVSHLLCLAASYVGLFALLILVLNHCGESGL